MCYIRYGLRIEIEIDLHICSVCLSNCLSLDHLFNLKFAAKELQRNAKKCEKDEKAEKTKLKQVKILQPFL